MFHKPTDAEVLEGQDNISNPVLPRVACSSDHHTSCMDELDSCTLSITFN